MPFAAVRGLKRGIIVFSILTLVLAARVSRLSSTTGGWREAWSQVSTRQHKYRLAVHNTLMTHTLRWSESSRLVCACARGLGRSSPCPCATPAPAFHNTLSFFVQYGSWAVLAAPVAAAAVGNGTEHSVALTDGSSHALVQVTHTRGGEVQHKTGAREGGG